MTCADDWPSPTPPSSPGAELPPPPQQQPTSPRHHRQLWRQVAASFPDCCPCNGVKVLGRAKAAAAVVNVEQDEEEEDSAAAVGIGRLIVCGGHGDGYGGVHGTGEDSAPLSDVWALDLSAPEKDGWIQILADDDAVNPQDEEEDKDEEGQEQGQEQEQEEECAQDGHEDAVEEDVEADAEAAAEEAGAAEMHENLRSSYWPWAASRRGHVSATAVTMHGGRCVR